MLESCYYKGKIEAGCDEAGRGCLAGSVYAAAVILPEGYQNELLDQLQVRPEAIIVDGNRFKPYYERGEGSEVRGEKLPHTTIVKGDGKYLSIAAASILAKTYRDDYMNQLAEEYPQYDWLSNKGYPTKKHREAIKQYGITPYHRKSYNLLGDGQLSLNFED